MPASPERMPVIRSVAILGAGAMGAQIAAHFANAGVPSLLLDLTADVARHGLERARTLKPDPFFTPDSVALISTGGFDADLARVAEADWIIEAVVERLDVKRDAARARRRARRPGVDRQLEHVGHSDRRARRGPFSEDFRRHWLGTHFFNPPRYLRLLEIIPTPDTDPPCRAAIVTLCRSPARQGRGRREGHAGLHRAITWRCTASCAALEALASGRYTIEEIDAITGPAIGRPKSATFRTLDIAGLDILGARGAQPARAAARGRRATRSRCRRLLDRCSRADWLGEKAGQGFYKREKSADGESEILTLDPATLDLPRRGSRHDWPRSRRRRPISDVRRARPHAVRRRGQGRRSSCARRSRRRSSTPPGSRPTIAHSIDDVDRVMRWGFGWELGPFELFDAIGVDAVVDAWRGSRALEAMCRR